MLIIGQKIIDLGSITEDLLPDSTANLRDLGSKSNQFAETHSRKIFAIDGTLDNGSIGANGSIIFGYVDGTSYIGAKSLGGVVGGVSKNGAFLYAQAGTSGAFVQGYAKSSSYQADIFANGDGCFSQGYSLGGSINSSLISSSGNGTFAQGHAKGGDMTTSGNGTFAQGFVEEGGTMSASGDGCFAQGNAGSNGNISATGQGSFAQGYVFQGSISTNGINCVQFGPGANTLDDSFKVGVGVSLSGLSTSDLGVNTRDGMIYTDGTNLLVRLNNNRYKIDTTYYPF